ncbi:MAG: DUF1573 domain-containing protein [Pirellulales bacterium]|nr:DUF1573 domain-containing protein [Pirellulales bacterium]
MRTWLWATLAVGLGFAVGVVVVIGQLGMPSEVPLPKPESSDFPAARAPDAPVAVDKGPPRVVVDQEVYDFGTMEAQSEKKHDFLLQNTGEAPLKIEDAGTTCKCAISKFETRVVNPGESTKVTLKWTAKGYFGPYEQIAKIRTNDPDRPELSLKVRGRVTTPLRAVPPEVVFSSVTAGQVARHIVKVFAYKSDDLELSDLRMQDPTTAEYFEIIPKRLSAEAIAQEKDARSGYELEVVVKPGLPLGRFQQTILVSTNVSDAPQIELPIKGKVGSDISIVGRDWDSNRQRLELGVLKRGEGADRTLSLVVRGRYRRLIDFEVTEVFPESLIKAELGDETSINEGVAIRVPLRIQIPKDSGPANYLGAKQGPTGRVILNTTHPHVPQISIPISFAIEGG